jgi:hypothetical protein
MPGVTDKIIKNEFDLDAFSAYCEGWDANETGLTIFDNPYNPEKFPEFRESWDNGWKDASWKED